MSEYKMVQIEGKNGMINLGIPEREATKEEIDELHKTVAEVVVNSSRQQTKDKKPAEK